MSYAGLEKNDEVGQQSVFCRKCGLALNESSWHQGYMRQKNKICRDCANEYSRIYQETLLDAMKNNPEWIQEQRERQAKYRDNVKKLCILYYSNGTMRCTNPDCRVLGGMDDLRALSIDHPNGEGAKHRKEIKSPGNAFYRWLIRNNFPPSFTCLCMNCQWIKRMENNENTHGTGKPLTSNFAGYLGYGKTAARGGRL